MNGYKIVFKINIEFTANLSIRFSYRAMYFYNYSIFGYIHNLGFSLLWQTTPGLAKASMLIFALATAFIGGTAALSVVNQDISRTIFLTGEVVREEQVIRAKFSDEPAQFSNDIPVELAAEIHENWFPNYVALIQPAEAKNLAGFDAALIESGDSTTPLRINEITAEMQNCEK